MNNWKLPPIVGEVKDRRAVILYELIDKEQVVHFTIEQGEKQYTAPNALMGPTRLLLIFKEDNLYCLDWYIDNHHAYQHHINVSNKVNQLICVSCDLLEADTNRSLWDIISNDITNKNTTILHCGDQIYGDVQYHACEKLKKRYHKVASMQDKLKLCYYQI